MTDILHTITAGRRQKRLLLALSFFIFHFSFSLAQIKVGGNVYGGGNEGYVGGSATVTVRSGNLNKVFGGARMANVGGNTYVNVDGEHASGYMVINYVFGGNDIAGTIGTAKAVGEEMPSELVDEDLKESTDNGLDNLWKADRRVDDTWNSYVHISSKTNPDGTVSNDNEKVFIGQVYAGGNGDYSYTPTGDFSEADVDVKDDDGSTVATLPYNFNMPHLDKTFLDVQGGTVAFAYGGGNAVTVREKAVIHVDNPSEVVTHLFVNKVTQLEDQTATEEGENVEELLTDMRIKQSMGINMTQEHVSSAEFQIGRFFGGNNKAEMAIQPTWNLQRGKIRNLYSGGNEGDMTHPVGLLLDIDPFEKYKDLLVINNVYGGCRKADIHPLNPDRTSPEPWEIQLSTTLKNKSGESYRFPEGLPARTLVRGGKVTNVYGGNDISGHVYGGNAVGIYTSILGDVYGGGNGSYAYTDKVDLSEIDDYKDFYYNPTTVLENEGIGGVLEADQSVTALNLFRPNAEQVSLRLWGKSAVEPTIIGGSVFVGGNSATLKSSKPNPKVELKIGSHVYADKVFLGNNGENMVKEEVLQKLKIINTINLEDTKQFSQYMDGCAMTISPRVVFDSETNGDPQTYTPYSSYFGSFYCGGNVGSMKFHGCTTIDIAQKVIIFDKLVGGSNKANVEQSSYNAAYAGGLLLEPDANGNKLVLNLSNLKLQPKRWKVQRAPEDYSSKVVDANGDYIYTLDVNGNRQLEWNVISAETRKEINPVMSITTADLDRRLLGANVYGGCCESGHVEGNVVININGTIVDREGEYGVFDTAIPKGECDPDILYDRPEGYDINARRSGVILDEQGMDVLGDALTVFGGGKGKDTEIWGNATVNINKGYCFQVFGGSESGVIGKPTGNTTAADGTYTPSTSTNSPSTYAFNGKLYSLDPSTPNKYSTYVNLNYNSTSGTSQGRPREVNNPDDDMADVEFIYGGSFEGPIIGNTIARLDNGRLFNLFAGSCNADILGHTETYVGENGFPWLRDHIYGGNDLGGEIMGVADFTSRLREGTYAMVHDASLLKANSYVEYRKGHTKSIFGGCFGDYDYNTEFKKEDGYDIPLLHNAFVNIRPDYNSSNTIEKVFGAGEGCPGVREGDKSQNCSYVLIDIEDTDKSFTGTEVFGAGSNNGLGMIFEPNVTFAPDFGNKATAVIDLLHGEISNVYGGSYNEGVTRRTMVNVPAESTIRLQNIFGGAYGTQILPPCDVYESNVNYNNTSENARLTGAIYGGNNNQRRTLYTRVNISSPVWQSDEKTFTANVFGAGRGVNTWSEYTEVNLESGARVYKAFGGAEEGHVLNAASVQAYMSLYKNEPSPDILAEDSYWKEHRNDIFENVDGKQVLKSDYKTRWETNWKEAWTIGSYYVPSEDWDNYAGNDTTNLSHVSERPELSVQMGDQKIANQIANQLDGQTKHNTNVIIKEGAVVDGYAYGGGLGNASIPLSGDVYGTTYIALLGGIVSRDIYAAGQTGALDNLFGATSFDNDNAEFKATANAYIQGGMVRNVYGGGYEGHVGYHDGDLTTDSSGDRLAKSYVVIGKAGPGTFIDGVPAILRNAYGGGEGGSVYGDTKLTLNNGYIGYRYKNIGTDQDPVYAYVEELDDQKPNAIELAGNVFGGGYVVNSYVDNAQIDLYGGVVRGCVYGGGEVGPIGRGTMKSGTYTEAITNGDAYIFKGGKTQVNMYDGHVLRNVFGGGRGHDSWGGDGTMYMKPEVVAQLDMKCKGYVFGQTEVNIHGGEIGTAEGMEQGFGNVFGGCDEGSVYSATGQKPDGDDKEGYYYNNDNGNLTEDCKVLVEPYAKALGTVTINSRDYAAGDYVPINDLNMLKGKDEDARWANIDPTGIIIHNAVFAGGNLAPGSNSVNANETTVFGNATATIHDVYNRDLITIGTGHTGGLYGDGNLTMVDGYRELNITNYGTDYYHIARELTLDKYEVLPEREKAYYELKYKCLTACTDIEGTSYSVNSELPLDELLELFIRPDGTSLQVNGKNIIIINGGQKTPNSDIWKANGVVTNYAGRIMNTIQRADFCGVFGSRMVMKGARDRVPEEVDYTNYTINRVREVSLNKVDSPAGDTDDTNKLHGNYFGIYNTVNFLGALTSDVDFQSPRTTKPGNESLAADGTTTFYDWKSGNIGNKTRNNGSCHNQLALASGVSLELTTEKSKGKTLNEKDWGLITGVVELDLINVQPGIGGGFVYAKNQHGVRSQNTNAQYTTLTALNNGAVTQRDFTYADPDEQRLGLETSGNFVHYSQTILDDCYNISNKYKKADGVPAHYWYIAGSVYVYDQYISAYTGSPNAFSQTAELPIVISAAANGKMTLMDVRPSLYAYYASYTSDTQNVKLGDNQKMVIGDVTYQLNDPINYWDWYKLSTAEKRRFVADTYVLKDSCKIGDKFYPAGYVMLPSEYTTLAGSAANVDLTPTDETNNPVKAVLKATVDASGNPVVVKDNDGDDVYVAVADAFRSSNNMSHNTGYLLTYGVTNPSVWGQWYTKIDSSTGEKQQTDASGYEDAPTYRLKSTITGGKVLGQREYAIGGIIPQKVYQDYQAITNKPSENQATFVPAYIVTKEYTGADKHYYPGAAVKEAISGYTEPAYVCTSTIKLSDTEYIYVNDLLSDDDISAYKTNYPSKVSDINSLIVPAYYCSVAGLYGGNYYSAGNNYRALEAWSSMSEDDRKNFTFNYDALDLLIDPTYGKQPDDGTQQAQGQKYQYDSAEATKAGADANAAHYSLPTPIDYTATYNGTNDETPHNGIKLTNGNEYSRENYEQLPNEQRHYAAINVAEAGNYYVVNTDFIHVETPYAVGTTLSSDAYESLTATEKTYITTLTFTSDQVKTDASGKTIPYYYCREEYKIGENTEGVEPTPLTITGATSGGIETRDQAKWVKAGTIIAGSSSGTNVGYESLKNYQKNFTIHGKSPMETSTLYVSRNSDIFDLSKEKVITVIYKYDYEESDADGMHITPVSERHVVNIHIKFESGVPIVPDIKEPDIVLPGTSVIMPTPLPTPGAYEITGGGWELYEKTGDAESHTNGIPFTPSETPLYWYQDEFYLAYYAKTYLGKTYSNHVPVHVANYHDLADVMADRNKEHHMYIDNPTVKREPKIYIRDYSESGKNGLDLFKDLYDLSIVSETADGYTVAGGKVTETTGTANSHLVDHSLLNNQVRAGRNLEFFLRTDIDRPSTAENPWTPIGYDGTSDDPSTPGDEGANGKCFDGVLHGDGHTISGLNNSLFNHLCGEVYNLGVTGSFTGAGVAETGDGYIESCWVQSSQTTLPENTNKTNAVFGNPTASGIVQVVNCYYPESNDALYNAGNAYKKPDRAFYNGEVAYDLNNFYLNKRYNDNANPGGSTTYKYWKAGVDAPLTGTYASNVALCSSGYNGLKYVEDRFADGDFIYDGGEEGGILPDPNSQDERYFLETVTNQGVTSTEVHYYPIWPDDYLFFGQKLTYGYVESQEHQEVPTAVAKKDKRLSQDTDANRVYRAPAYYRSSKMGVAHFNPYAVFAQTKKDNAATLAYKGMTAIDFTGSNGDVVHGYQKGYDVSTPYANITGGAFYPPLLDDDGLTGFLNVDQTRNLLVYTAATGANTTAAEKTATVVSSYLNEPVYTESTEGYRKVAKQSSSDIHGIHGHWVENGTATRDHLLVDKEDFNAPISYTFAAGKRMWYQRTPDNFAGKRIENGTTVSAGWEGISLPFSAELVTTNEKGEITHFYEFSETSKNSTTKIGHEYWLRRLVDGSTMTQKTGDTNTLVAKFTYPSENDGSVVFNKTGDHAVTNTFLWDYYYSGNHQQEDKNSDIYQKYYSDSREYSKYPLLTNGTPYLIGLPGKTYYEFDLSGEWEALTTGDTKPAKLDKQTITFASVPGPETTIQVSDGEMGGNKATYNSTNDYYFKPNYLNSPDLETGNNAFLLNAEGNSYVEDKTATTDAVYAFRPYFEAAPSGSGSRELTRSIVFHGDEDGIGPREGKEIEDLGAISARAGRHKIIVSSTRKYITDVRIVNAAGQVIATLTINPGETIETRIINGGVYIVQDEDGEYIKKLVVK